MSIADALVSRLVEFTAAPRTKADIEHMLEAHLAVAPERRRMDPGVSWA